MKMWYNTHMNAFNELFSRYPLLKGCESHISDAFNALLACYQAKGKVLVCGNGSSAVDAEHIVCELMNKFKKRRPIDCEVSPQLPSELACNFVGALSAAVLVAMSAKLAAIAVERLHHCQMLPYAFRREGHIRFKNFSYLCIMLFAQLWKSPCPHKFSSSS